MTSPQVLITSVFLKPGDEVDRLLTSRGYRTVHAPNTGPGRRSPEQLLALVREADAAIVATEPFTRSVLERASRLKVIARTGAGYDSIDVHTATSRGIAVCNQPGVNAVAVAELTLTLLLMSARQIRKSVDSVRQGGWERPDGDELSGMTLGLVGLGAIGKIVARLAAALGMEVIAHDPYIDEAFAKAHGIRPESLEGLLRTADYVSLHMPLTDSTRHLMGAEQFALMKPTAHLVNTSRGPVVDEEALIRALVAGDIAGAALDVVEHEPLPAESPLRSLDKVLLTAHLGGATRQARTRSGLEAAETVISVLEGGLPANAINPDYAEVDNIAHGMR